jgi:GTPase SAR1 family protein
MYDPNYMELSDGLPVCTMLVGQSNSGKTTLLVNLLIKKLLWEYEPENIYFFSKTIVGDKTYRPILRYLADNDKTLNIYKNIDFKIIDKLVKDQEYDQIMRMATIDKDESDWESNAEDPKIPAEKRILFIFDDMLSDRQFKSHNSLFSDFTTYSRHYGIQIIINTQKFNKIPTTIREQSPLSILCSVDNYQDSMVNTYTIRGYKKWFDKMFSEMCQKKDHSFLVVSKHNKIAKRFLMYDNEDSRHPKISYLSLPEVPAAKVSSRVFNN